MTVRICPAGTFAAALPRGCLARPAAAPRVPASGPPVVRLTGRWLVGGGLTVTAVSIPP
jgi:hypothetical protein